MLTKGLSGFTWACPGNPPPPRRKSPPQKGYPPKNTSMLVSCYHHHFCLTVSYGAEVKDVIVADDESALDCSECTRDAFVALCLQALRHFTLSNAYRSFVVICSRFRGPRLRQTALSWKLVWKWQPQDATEQSPHTM